MKASRSLLRILLLLLPVTAAQALYDPMPLPQLAFIEGRWSGYLTYRDYQEPHDLVTLKTQLVVALLSPDRIALHLIYDDGPDKTVHSYETLSLNLTAHEAHWGDETHDYPYRIVKTDQKADGSLTLLLESRSTEPGKPARTEETLELAPNHFSFEKRTGGNDGPLAFSSRHGFDRS